MKTQTAAHAKTRCSAGISLDWRILIFHQDGNERAVTALAAADTEQEGVAGKKKKKKCTVSQTIDPHLGQSAGL